MDWNPLDTSSWERRLAWATVAAWAMVLQGPAFVDNFGIESWQERGTLPDFFQEWASARNYFDGLPIYTNHAVPIERYFAGKLDVRRSLVIVNAHPPTSVLAAFPFAGLDFHRAFLVWNLVSLPMLAISIGLVFRELALPFGAWSILPLISLLLLCSPLWQQIHQGQWNLCLLLLITGTWAADRSGRPRLAGVLLGTATAIKLFPGFLLLYFAQRRRWATVGAGLATLAALTGLTLAVLGAGTYVAYARDVLPEVQWFRVGWNNNTICGFWSRLFDPEPGRVRDFSRSEPIIYDPTLSKWLTRSSIAGLLLIYARAIHRSRPGRDDDKAFSLAVTTMLLVSPIAWEHYFLLLLVPLAVLYLGLPRRPAARICFLTISAALWLSPVLVWTWTGIGGNVARPIDNLVVIPYQFYALLALFALGIVELEAGRAPDPLGSTTPDGVLHQSNVRCMGE